MNKGYKVYMRNRRSVIVRFALIEPLLCGKESCCGGGKDADCGCVSRTASVAELLLASERLLGLLFLQQVLELVARRARGLKDFQYVLEIGLERGRNVVASPVFQGLFTDFAILDKLLLCSSRGTSADDQAPAENSLRTIGSQGASHRCGLAALNSPAGMSGDALVALLAHCCWRHFLDDGDGHNRHQKQQFHLETVVL